MRNKVIGLSIAISLSAIPLMSQIRFIPPDPAKIEARLHKAEVKNPERQAALESLFNEVGCARLAEQPVKSAKTPNIICTLPGESDDQIIIGAHYDKVPDGRGVVDNWSGASMLPTILESLKGEKRHHTLVFIGFTNEEEGEIGSHFYVKQLTSDQIKKIVAMVNMDTLALGPTEVWASHADPGLVNKAFGLAQAMKVPLKVMNVERVGSTDSEQFREKNIPAITFHSLTNATFPILHSSKDDFAPVKMDDYCESARLIAAYVAYLDTALAATLKDADSKETPGK